MGKGAKGGRNPRPAEDEPDWVTDPVSGEIGFFDAKREKLIARIHISRPSNAPWRLKSHSVSFANLQLTDCVLQDNGSGRGTRTLTATASSHQEATRRTGGLRTVSWMHTCQMGNILRLASTQVPSNVKGTH